MAARASSMSVSRFIATLPLSTRGIEERATIWPTEQAFSRRTPTLKIIPLVRLVYVLCPIALWIMGVAGIVVCFRQLIAGASLAQEAEAIKEALARIPTSLRSFVLTQGY